MVKKMRKFAFPALLVLLLLIALPVIAFASQVVPGDALVVFREPAVGVLGTESRRTHASAIAAETEAQVKGTFDALSRQGKGIFALLHSDTKTAEELVAELEARPDVLAAAPNYITHAFRTPNDPRFTDGSLWGLSAIYAPSVWDTTTGSGSVYVAVMDTGIQADHPDLAGNFEGSGYSRNFYNTSSSSGSSSGYEDDNGHGTHVAGTIGAVGNNDRGVAGVNWTVKLISLKTLGSNGSGSTSGVVYALNYLVDLLGSNASLNLAAVNLSLGYYSSRTPTQAKTADPVWRAMSALSELGRTLICVAAGNEMLEIGEPCPATGTYNDTTVNRGEYCYPASFTGIDNMIVVGGAKSATELDTSYSNYSSTYVDIAAPGTDIVSTYIEDNYAIGDGTSMASPHVAGTAALLRAVYPNSTASHVRAAIVAGARNASSFSAYTRYGFLDAKGALDQMEVIAQSVPSITTASLPGGTVGTAYSRTLSAAGATPITWSLSGSLPDGLELKESTGEISGTPTAVGTYSFTVRASNSVGSGTADLSITIQAASSNDTPSSSNSSGGGGCDAAGLGLLGLTLLGLFCLAF